MIKKFHDAGLDEKFVSGKDAFTGRLLKVKVDQVRLPNGQPATRELIRHPGAVAILPVLPDGSLVFVKQYRYPIATVLYEIPAGKLEPGEDRAACGPRELSEETGYDAEKMTYLTSVVTTPGFSDEVIYIYVAEGLTLHQAHPDPDEFLNVEVLSPEKVKKMVLDGTIYDAKTLAALCYWNLKH